MVPSLRSASCWITTQGFECIKTSSHSASSFPPDPSSAWRFHDLPSICHLDAMIHCFFHSVPMILKFPTVCPSVPYDPAFPPLSQCLSSPLLCLSWWRKAHNNVHRHHKKFWDSCLQLSPQNSWTIPSCPAPPLTTHVPIVPPPVPQTVGFPLHREDWSQEHMYFNLLHLHVVSTPHPFLLTFLSVLLGEVLPLHTGPDPNLCTSYRAIVPILSVASFTLSSVFLAFFLLLPFSPHWPLNLFK